MGSRPPKEELVDALILVVVVVVVDVVGVNVGVEVGVEVDVNTPPALLLVSCVEATRDAGLSRASYVLLGPDVNSFDAFDVFDGVEKGEATGLALAALATPA